MARRRRNADGRNGVQPPAPAALNAPFADLRKRMREVAPPPEPQRPAPRSPASRAAAEEPTLFAQAMEGVVPLRRGSARRVEGPAPTSVMRPPVSEDVEALAALSDLVRGEARFDVSDTREYVEGAIVGLDPRLLRRLRRGDFSWQAHLDLHGMTADDARPAVDEFLRTAVRAGHRCVLIVHGRGHNSKDRTPVLKERLKVWLSRGGASRVILAFASARPCDGGAGALYVLLRRDRRRRTIQVTEGAKR